MIYTPEKYQQFATQFILEKPACGIFLDMGLGKTIVTLTALSQLLYDSYSADKVLVIAPLMAAKSTWPFEVTKWRHTSELRVSCVIGSVKARESALQKEADIYIINRENVKWLVEQYMKKWPFDTVVIDELSSFKNNSTQRFRALRKVRPLIKRVIGLTGTPAPNSLMDLWAQIYLLDKGERLGKFLTSYRDEYFSPGKRNGQVIFNYNIKKGAEKEIYSKIDDICVTMKSEDYLSLPERIDRSIALVLPEKATAAYKRLERELVLPLLEDGVEITAVNAAGLTNKLLQLANGAVYGDDKNYHEIHTEKISALQEIIDTAAGRSVLVFYSYKHDLLRLLPTIDASSVRVLRDEKDIEDWNKREIQVLLAHPASAGHGLNLQAGGNIIVWFGLTWSLELYQQANKRLHRRGQTETVIVHHLLCKGTVDEQVMHALSRKEATQNDLIEAIKARINNYKK